MRAVWLLFLVTACVEFDHGDRAKPDAPEAPTAPVDAPPGDSGVMFATPKVVHTSAQYQVVASTVSVPLSQPSSGGHMMVVGVSMYSDLTSVASVVDDANTPYKTAGARATTSSGGATDIWYGVAPAGATTVTVNLSGFGGGAGVWVLELSGVDTSAPKVAIGTDLGTGAMIASPTVMTSSPNAVVFSLVEIPGGTISGMHPGSLFSMLPTLYGDAGAYTIAAAPGPYTAAWDETGGTGACSSTAAFAPAKL